MHQHIPFIPAALICAIVAMLTSILMNPIIIKLAYKKHLTDTPNYRKLQKKPIPVLGGMSVYLALVMGLFFSNFFYPTDRLYVVIAGMSVIRSSSRSHSEWWFPIWATNLVMMISHLLLSGIWPSRKDCPWFFRRMMRWVWSSDAVAVFMKE